MVLICCLGNWASALRTSGPVASIGLAPAAWVLRPDSLIPNNPIPKMSKSEHHEYHTAEPILCGLKPQ